MLGTGVADELSPSSTSNGGLYSGAEYVILYPLLLPFR